MVWNNWCKYLFELILIDLASSLKYIPFLFTQSSHMDLTMSYKLFMQIAFWRDLNIYFLLLIFS